MEELLASDIIGGGHVLAWVKDDLERGCRPMGMQEASRLKPKERNQAWDSQRRSKLIPTSSPILILLYCKINIKESGYRHKLRQCSNQGGL